MKWATKTLGMTLTILSLVLACLSTGVPAAAISSNPTVFISGDNTFYAFMQTGERVNVSVLNSGLQDASVKKQPVTVTVEAPGDAKKVCNISADTPTGTGCGFSQLIAVKAGIWKFSFSLPADAQTSKINPNQHLGGNLFRWDITIFDNQGIKAGRLWSEQYTIRQPDVTGFAADMTFYYQSEDGYLYRAIYKGYSGQLSNLSADAFGVVKNGGCESAYKSIEISDANYAPSFGKCGGNYKIFFESPSDDLPVTATRWDGSLDWVRPSVLSPEVSELKFTPDNGSDAQSGTISFKLKNFIGHYDIKVDPTGEGNYDSSKVVTKVGAITELNDPGAQLLKFDGLDKAGNKIPKNQPIKIKLQISKGAEIHLVGANVIGRVGGLTLTRLSGDNAPSSNVCWDDTELTTMANMDKAIEPDGKSCPDSLDGVHKWPYAVAGAKSWGANRYIDDWIYASAQVKGGAEIGYPSGDANASNQIIARGAGIGMIIGVAIVILALIGGGIYWMKRRNNRKHDGDNLLPPSQFPPTPPTQPPMMQ